MNFKSASIVALTNLPSPAMISSKGALAAARPNALNAAPLPILRG